ncbi:NUDIX domain-containing protein [Burkholderia territorii]|uniref:NUDIX domain-containing protein n=1 Tax=Burkholderia territorii TaxID=1503055 RepID=UPI0009BD053B|nr:NUDIX domain-containing protein [Burkholderia territorii]
MKQRATVICRRAGRLLLVAKPEARWSLPGGKVCRVESPIEAARRELEEETQLVALRLDWLFEFAGKNTLHQVFVAHLAALASPRASHEIARCRWFRAEQIIELPLSASTRGGVERLGWGNDPRIRGTQEASACRTEAASLTG